MDSHEFVFQARESHPLGAQLLPDSAYQIPPPTIFIEDGANAVRVRSLVLHAAESHDGAECSLSCAGEGSGIRPGLTE